MSAGQLDWREMAQLLGGIALVAFIQTGLMFHDARDFIGSWIIVALFGAIYAVIDGATWIMFERRRRQSTP
jgi:hypothetical protein